MGNDFESEDYNPYKDIFDGTRHAVRGASTAWKIIKSKGIKVVLIAVGAILIPIIVVFLVWGWQIKVELAVNRIADWEADTFYSIQNALSSIDEKKYYFYKEGEETFVQYVNDEDETVTCTLNEFLADPYCFYLLIESKDVDISDSDTWNLDDSDVDTIFKYILEEEAARKERITKTYDWPSKLYDYDYHWENNQIYNEETGKMEDHWERVRNDYPEWMPDDVWEKDYTDRAHWRAIQKGSVQLSKKDVNGEKDEVDGLDKFMMRWQMVVGISTLISYHNNDNWGDTGDEWVDKDNPEFFVDMDGYYLNDETMREVVDAFTYDFTFYNDDWNVKNYDFEDMEKTCYRATYHEMEEVHTPGEWAFIRKEPAVAPRIIKNRYERYIYEYAPTDDGYGKYICTGRSKYVNAVAFAELIEGFCPDWKFSNEEDYSDFIQLLEHFPAADRVVARVKELKAIYDWQMETGEEWFPEEVSLGCYSLGVRVGRDIDFQLIESPTFIDSEEYIYVPPTEVLDLILGEFCVPTQYASVTSGFGLRVDPVYGDVRGHAGIDLGTAGASPSVGAAFGGKVITTAYDKGGYGNYVVIQHSAPDGTNFYTLYAHLASLNTVAGSTVNPGDLIGFVGSTGKSTGNHLHFEVRINGNSKANAVDPNLIYDFVNKRSK